MNGIMDYMKFLTEIKRENRYKATSTGFSDVDNLIYGGFIPHTLTVIYGAPAIGKTAFCQQIAEGMAKKGTHVIYWNFEMNAEALYARSTVRTAMNLGNSISYLDIQRYADQNEKTRNKIDRAAAEYAEQIAPFICYNPKETRELTAIKEATETELKNYCTDGNVVVVILDYLQIIEVIDTLSGNMPRRITDPVQQLKNVLNELNDLKNKYNVIIIAVSASNRESNKDGTVFLESGRDTSALEYSGDLILGLGYTAIEEGRTFKTVTKGKGQNETTTPIPYDLKIIRELKRKAQQDKTDAPEVCYEVMFKVMKNRFGMADTSSELFFDARHFRFMSYDTWITAEKTKTADAESQTVIDKSIKFDPEYEQTKIT